MASHHTDDTTTDQPAAIDSDPFKLRSSAWAYNSAADMRTIERRIVAAQATLAQPDEDCA